MKLALVLLCIGNLKKKNICQLIENQVLNCIRRVSKIKHSIEI